MKKLTSILLSTMLLASLWPSAISESTTVPLTVALFGFALNDSGDALPASINGTFDVSVNGTYYGQIASDGSRLSVPAGDLLLVPVSIPDGWAYAVDGYACPITAAAEVCVPVVLWQNAGGFQLTAQPQSTFTLMDESGSAVSSFTTDEAGTYTTAGVPVGFYYLKDSDGINSCPFYIGMATSSSDFVQVTSCEDDVMAAVNGNDGLLLLASASPSATDVLLPEGWQTDQAVSFQNGRAIVCIPAYEELFHLTLTAVNDAADPNMLSIVEPLPTPEPTAIPTPEPTAVPTPEPTAVPTPEPTAVPTPEPTAVPTPEPTAVPTPEPTAVPTPEPTAVPTPEPTAVPTPEPTAVPTPIPVGSSSLTVSVFLDSNNNGERGTYEKDVSDVKLTLLLNGTAIASAVTNKTGTAVFGSLPAGQYALQAELSVKHGFSKHGTDVKATSNLMDYSLDNVQTSSEFTLADGAAYEVGIGALPTGIITGQVWLDESANGIRESTEGGMENVTITLTNPDTEERLTTISGEGGWYSFPRIPEGKWRLRVVLPDGYGNTRYSSKGGENRSVITTDQIYKQFTISSKTNFDKQYIGLIEGAEFSGICFMDANYNGIYDEGEQTISGVKIEATRLYSENSTTVISDSKGHWSIAGLRAATYTIRVVLPETGIYFTKVTEGGNQFAYRTGRRENSINITLEKGQGVKLDIGAVKLATVSGTSYFDTNFSGSKDKKEETSSGVLVSLYDSTGKLADETRTNAKGTYTFSEVMPGSYYIQATAARNHAFTKLGSDNVLHNVSNGVGRSDLFTVPMGSKVTGKSLGMVLPGIINGRVFADANDNGKMDQGETGLTNTVVTLIGGEDGPVSTTVDSTGIFRFDAVMPGTYTLHYAMPENGILCGRSINDPVSELSVPNIKIASGETINVNDVGGLTLGAVRGSAFLDPNGNGYLEDGETGAAGVVVTLTPSRSDLSPITLITADDGCYDFSQLHPDHYQLTVTWPDGYVESRIGSLELGLNAGYASQTIDVSIPMGRIYENQLIGGVKPGSISGSVWLDENNNGLFEGNETMLAGIQVTMIDNQTGTAFTTLTTDAAGHFSHAGVVPGDYRLVYTLSEAMNAAKAGTSTFTAADGLYVMDHIAVTEGTCFSDISMGLVRYNTLTGRVWLDEGGEILPLPGTVVTLLTQTGTALSSVTTSEDGTYAFGGLLPGGYYITCALPEGHLVVDPNDERLATGAFRSVMAQASGRTGQSALLELTMTGTYSNMDIGSVIPGRLGDYCWLDVNGNGLQDSGEYGLANITIEVMRGGQVIASTVTDQYGYWFFREIYPASYTLRITPPAELKPTIHRTDIPSMASVLEETDGTVCTSYPVSAVSGKRNYNADIGFALRDAGVYPEGYGQFSTQDWTKIK